MASKRKQDEKNLKLLRKLASNEHNKRCFDCGQRGPTYVNMTIGSFVCTSCSGLLRGLNPPQRVKSISMTSFTQQEIEQLQKSGNEYCRRVWLGLWNSHLPPEPESRDEQRVKDFLIKKYEKKAYYVPPDQVKPVPVEKEKEPEVRPLKSLLGQNTPKVQVSQTSSWSVGRIKQPPPSSSSTQPVTTLSSSSVGSIKQPPPTSSSTQPVAFAPPPGTNATSAPAAQPKRPSQDLLGDLGGDPFAAPPQPTQADAFGGPAQGAGGFADFGQAFGGGQPAGLAPSGSQSTLDDLFASPLTSDVIPEGSASFPPASQPSTNQPAQNAFGAFGAPAQPTSQASFAAFGGATMDPMPAAPVSQASNSFADLSLSNSTPSADTAASNADKYSALSELDSIFSNPSGSSASVFGGAPAPSSSSSVFGQSSPPKSSGFGQSSSQHSLFAQTNQASSSMYGQPAATTSMFGGTQAATVPAAGGMEANPFGGFSSAQVGQPATQQAMQPNPFMAQAGDVGRMPTIQSQHNGMFGATSQVAAFGWGGQQPVQATARFGQMPAQAQAGFGQMPQQNANMGAYGQYGAQPGMVAHPGMMGQPGMAMGTQPQLGAGAMQLNGGVGRGVPQGPQGGMNMQGGYHMQAPGGYAMPYNKVAGGQQMASGFGQMVPGQQQQQAAPFGTWNPNAGGAIPQQNNPFMGQSAVGMPPKAQSSNPFM